MTVTIWDDTPTGTWPVWERWNETVYVTRDHAGSASTTMPASWSGQSTEHSYRSVPYCNGTQTTNIDSAATGNGNDSTIRVLWDSLAGDWQITSQVTSTYYPGSGTKVVSATPPCNPGSSQTVGYNAEPGEEDLHTLGTPTDQALVGFLETGDTVAGTRVEWRLWRVVCDTNIDTDNDRISDCDEASTWGTDPNVADTDGGGVDDGVELLDAHTNPRVGADDNSPEPDVILTWPDATNPRPDLGTIDRYEVTVEQVAGPLIFRDSNVTTTSCDVAGLADNTDYHFTVTAFTTDNRWSGDYDAFETEQPPIHEVSTMYTTSPGPSLSHPITGCQVP